MYLLIARSARRRDGERKQSQRTGQNHFGRRAQRFGRQKTTEPIAGMVRREIVLRVGTYLATIIKYKHGIRITDYRYRGMPVCLYNIYCNIQ